MEANLLMKPIDHRANSRKVLISRMLYLVQRDADLMQAYCAIADNAGGKTLQCHVLIGVVERSLTERYIKAKIGGGEEKARRYVCSILDLLVEQLFCEKTWEIAKEALHKKLSCVSDTPNEAELVEV